MAYSNGYNMTLVLPALFGRLGWTGGGLNTANTSSKSGRKFDDGSFHSLVTVQNVKDTIPEPKEPDTWDNVFTAKQNAVIARALNEVFKQLESLETGAVFNRYFENEQVIEPSGRVRGIRIKLANDPNISAQIRKLQLFFTESATFKVFLYKQGKRAPLKEQDVTTVANEITEVEIDDWILNSAESLVYYVMFFDADLGTAKPIRQQGFWKCTKAFAAESIETNAIAGTDFNRESLSIPGEPCGLNLVVSSFRDHTHNILNQPALFDNLLGLCMAYQVIEDIIYAVRSNATERITKDQLSRAGINMELTGNSSISEVPHSIGLRQRINKEADRIRKEFYPVPKAQNVSLC